MSSTPRPSRRGKRLLIASIGVATISYASAQGCGDDSSQLPGDSGNLLPPPRDASIDSGRDWIGIDSGNLLAPPPLKDAALDSAFPVGGDLPPPHTLDSGNVDSGSDASGS